MRYNELGQPTGELLPDWTAAQRPTQETLLGRTVRLEPLDTSHAAGLFAGLESAPAGHWTYMPWGPFDTVDAYEHWVDVSLAADDIEYLVVCSPAGSPLGVAGYLNIVPDMGSIEVGGITYTPELQGTVEATEAMYLMMAHVFEDLGYRRYEWKCDALNAASRAAALRLGFVYEGTFLQHRVTKGRNRDTAWFAMTDGRWRSIVGPALRTWLSPSNFDDDGMQRSSLREVRTVLERGG